MKDEEQICKEKSGTERLSLNSVVLAVASFFVYVIIFFLPELSRRINKLLLFLVGRGRPR